jgi:FAD/FMN-containing dehydrogenase
MAPQPPPPQANRPWPALALFGGVVLAGSLPAAALLAAIRFWNLPIGTIAALGGVLLLSAVLLALRLTTLHSRRGLPVTRWRRIRAATTVAVVFIAVLIGRPVVHLTMAAWNDRDDRPATPPGFVDDASRMNETRVAEVWEIPKDTGDADRQLAALLKRAKQDGLKVSIAGARHSMGGHTISPDGIVVDMLPFHRMSLDEKTNILHVQTGARWSEIIPFLDRRGRSVSVMQSNNSFSVGGSISVNCHGWQHGKPPIASTVESFRLMKADGTIVRCSRKENRELFSLALGGYGLFGIILDVDLRVVPNERYRSEQFVVPINESLQTYDETLRRIPNATMVYARMNISRERFLQDVVLTVYVPDATGGIPPLAERRNRRLRRTVFRGSLGSDYGKRLRWFAETRLQPLLAKRFVSRNQLLNEGVEVFQDRSDKTTDILHEYFVPRSGIAGFVEDLRRIVPARDGDLLNVTVRSVNRDDDTFLRYAEEHVFALVMLFSQERSADGDARMQAMTREMIEAVLSRGGRYYLPYRLHATPRQFHRAYPQARRFFQLKRKYDPDELFQNRFYLKYGKP